MNKVLDSYTIIPPNLYVHRDADRQVKNIVNSMGRPGYVLVSRQMGKTNLLLNAKRELESSKDAFIYIDLSNPFDTVKDCFQNIIDTAIETRANLFQSVSETIAEKRSKSENLPAHRQHLNELKLLLNSIEGKLVIILDEIDALTKTSYSEQIFSQIRAMYFTRTDYPERNRLTYLLSGVIEPTELIKDPKISPFNIGEQIFLNDFSKDEFHKFISNANLYLNSDVIDRVYFWASGNPRMSWDVCSEIEGRLQKSESISPKIVDDIVKKIYLTTFDKPPIDNIRELVKNDREIRNSIVEIGYQKGSQISDKTKRKLYLSGIINYEENDVKIKNNIISESLNSHWIHLLEEEEKGLVGIALDRYDKGRYEEALENFERFLEGNAFEAERESFLFLCMGHSAYNIKDYDKAIACLDKTKFDKKQLEFLCRTCNIRGLSYFYKNDFDSSIKNFSFVLNNSERDETYLRALVNLGSSIFSLNEHKSNEVGWEKSIDDAISIFKRVVGDTGTEDGIKQPLLNKLKSVAYYNLSKMVLIKGDSVSAKNYLESALSCSVEQAKPLIYRALFDIAESAEEKIHVIRLTCEHIISNNLTPIQPDPEHPLLFNIDQLNGLLLNSYSYDRDVSFHRLISESNLFQPDKRDSAVFDLGIYAITSGMRAQGLSILNELYTSSTSLDWDINNKTRYNTLKYLAYLSGNNEKYISEYVKAFFKNHQNVDYLDFVLVATRMHALTQKGFFEEALSLSEFVDSIKKDVEGDLLVNYVIIYNLKLSIFISTRNHKFGKPLAKSIIDLCSNEDLKSIKNGMLGDTGLEIIKQNAENYLSTVEHRQPVVASKRIGRNDVIKVKYLDGRIIQNKYKRLQVDLDNGACSFL